MVSRALLLLGATKALPAGRAAKRVALMLAGKAPSAEALVAMAEAVAAAPIPLPPLDLPILVAPRFSSWARVKTGKTPKGAVLLLIMESLCMFFFQQEQQVPAHPDSVVHLVGVDIETIATNPVKFAIVAPQGALAFVKYGESGRPKAVAGVKRIDVELKKEELTKRWVHQLKKMLVVAMFAAPRAPLDIPPLGVTVAAKEEK
jgi:hypothetical protein